MRNRLSGCNEALPAGPREADTPKAWTMTPACVSVVTMQGSQPEDFQGSATQKCWKRARWDHGTLKHTCPVKMAMLLGTSLLLQVEIGAKGSQIF